MTEEEWDTIYKMSQDKQLYQNVITRFEKGLSFSPMRQ